MIFFPLTITVPRALYIPSELCLNSVLRLGQATRYPADGRNPPPAIPFEKLDGAASQRLSETVIASSLCRVHNDFISLTDL